MSAAKRVKLEVDIENPAAEKKAEIIVDLGNGVLVRLRTHGAEEATIQEEPWQLFKAELYQSEFWQQYKERRSDWDTSDQGPKDAYNEVIEREIQRAWDESGKGSKVLRMPQSVSCEEFSSFWDPGGEQPLPDSPLCDQGVNAVEGGEPQSGGVVEPTIETVMSLSGGGGRPQRYLVTVEYLGSRFLGWQKQKSRPDLRTVQGALEVRRPFVVDPLLVWSIHETMRISALLSSCILDLIIILRGLSNSDHLRESKITGFQDWKQV